MSGWLEAITSMRAEWKCTTMKPGALSVMTSGVLKTQMSFVVNWDLEWVSNFHIVAAKKNDQQVAKSPTVINHSHSLLMDC